jgi:hypothetical protein
MIQKITRLKTPMTKKLELKYINLFCEARNEGYNVEIAFAKAHQYFLSHVVDLLLAKPNDTGIIGVAYDNIKFDKSLQEKALNFYALTKCKEDVKNKYMPLLMQ